MKYSSSPAVPEIIDARMFQESSQDADDLDGFRQTRDARAQAAGIPHDQVDLYARLGGAVQRAGDVHILQRVHLELDKARGSRWNAA